MIIIFHDEKVCIKMTLYSLVFDSKKYTVYK